MGEEKLMMNKYSNSSILRGDDERLPLDSVP